VRAAIDAPRIHDQGMPPALALEAGVPPDARTRLEQIGHRLMNLPAAGAVSAAGLDARKGPVAAGDRRKDGGQTVVE
jgi:gamma-glutamyltranspeptidase